MELKVIAGCQTSGSIDDVGGSPVRTSRLRDDARRRGTRGRSFAVAIALPLSLIACSSDGAGSDDPSMNATDSADDTATTAEPTTPGAQAVEAGLGKHVEGDLDGASADYRAALESDPDNVLALYNLGLIAQTEGDEEEAEARYRAVLAVDQEYQPAVFNLAIIRKAAGDAAEAEQLYREAIALRPGDAGAHLNLGLLLREAGEQAEGDAEVATALELNPEFVDPGAAASG